MTDVDSHPPNLARRRRRVVWGTVLVIAIVGGGIGLALFQPWRIFTRSAVDEALPTVAAQSQALASEMVSVAPLATAAIAGPPTTLAITPEAMMSTGAETPAPTQAPISGAPLAPGMVAPAEVTPTETATAEIETGKTPVGTEPVVLASGTFLDGEHSTSGTASILQLPDGSRFVRLEGFSTSDGPDVDVWLTDQQAGGDEWGKYDDGRYIPLGDLKGTDGNQNYAIPGDAELAGLTSVVVWCDRFNVAFGSAPIVL